VRNALIRISGHRKNTLNPAEQNKLALKNKLAAAEHLL
jgi:hypothetical protein